MGHFCDGRASLVVGTHTHIPTADAQGHRLGQGGGYYDRTLHQLRLEGPIIAIGLAFAEQEVEALPADDLDQRLDGILTETGYRAFS